MNETSIAGQDDLILVTGASGFIGRRVVAALLERGFGRLRCLVRPSSRSEDLRYLQDQAEGRRVEIQVGNLLSPSDCAAAVRDVSVIYHLAAGRGEKFFADAFLNSVVTTRNLLDAARESGCLRRFVSVSTFSVYRNQDNPTGRLLNEECALEERPHLRGDAYTFAKAKQDELIMDYGKRFAIPYVIVRPGVVYGPGNEPITGRAGIGTFGLFLHLGGSNRLPLTYVDNCADAIVLAGLQPQVEGEIFNVVDDDPPTSREFLKQYKQNVRQFPSIYIPHGLSYLLCWLWEKYSDWTDGQLPPAFNRRIWHAYWKRTEYSNAKLKARLGWTSRVPVKEALHKYFESCRRALSHA